MKKNLILFFLSIVLVSGCGNTARQQEQNLETSQAEASPQEKDSSSQVATSQEMAEVLDVVEEGMVPVTGDSLQDGVYDIVVSSSSTMFQISSCQLTVEGGTMTADMSMGGTGYLYLFLGTGEEAAAAEETEYIPFVEKDGVHHFILPVEALDEGIPCAAFSKRKEKWYDRTILFRADSLPATALQESSYTTLKELDLEDGIYDVEVSLEGGSGRASVESSAELQIQADSATVRLCWSSPNYDYMLIDEQRYEPVNTEGNSVFEIPVNIFDYKMPVIADTTAMSTPYEINYTLYFDSSTIKKK